jgi:C4-dicarboxylate-specific signal transduction histidine kinase
VYSTIVPIKNQSNQICYYVSVRHDITAQKEVQAQLIQASKLSALGEATAKIAHELNNPLAVIFGLTQMLLKRGDLSEKSQEQTVKVQKAAERMNRLIQQMKKHSRNSSEDPKQVLILGEIINNSLILVEGSLKNNGIGLTVTIPEEPFQIFGDVVQIESVIQNLITNSVDAFNKPHSGNEIRDRKIQLGLKNEGDFAVLSYEDNAGGIPESVQKHMFDTFFTTKEAGKGTGLGLSMIKSIIQEHQAQLSFSSELGKGTRFVIKFPRYPCKESLKTIKSAV